MPLNASPSFAQSVVHNKTKKKILALPKYYKFFIPGSKNLENVTSLQKRSSSIMKIILSISKMPLKILSLIIAFQGFVFPLNSQLLPDFNDELLDNSLQKPVGLVFDKSGNAYIWQQGGTVHLMDTSGVISQNPFIDLSEEITEYVDHGLLGFALDPQFETNGYVYLLYVVDLHHLLYFNTPQYDPDATIINDASIGRITRYTSDPVTNFQTVIPESRKVLLGNTIEDGFPIVASSHGVGTITFGTDTTLIASCGDTGSFAWSDAGNHPESFYEKAVELNIIQPDENVGAYRSMMYNSLNGKIIRIDRNTGEGIPSNPFFRSDAPSAKVSKIWAMGLRNPFRIYLDPQTGSHNPEDANPGVLYIGDVGGVWWEELNIATHGGLNFGWPVFEGMQYSESFEGLVRPNKEAPNELFGQDQCEQEFFSFHDLIVQPHEFINPKVYNPCDGSPLEDSLFAIHQRPALAWLNHIQMMDSIAVVPAFDDTGAATQLEIENPQANIGGLHFNGGSSLAGFYYNGDNFPEEYQGRYFHADFNGWIKIIDFDVDYNVVNIDTFAQESVKGIVDFKVSPHDGCIYYVKAIEGPGIHRICFGGDPPPIAIANADIYYGVSPLTVVLDASESYHPKEYPFTVEWQLPDGTTSNQTQLQYIFTSNTNDPTPIEVTLVITDSVGNTKSDQLIISLNNTPPQVNISSINDGDLYPISDFSYLSLEAVVDDIEQVDSELFYTWQTFLHHNTHNHAGPLDNNKSSYTLIEPAGCDGESYWYRIELTVDDGAGLTTTDFVEIFPNCDLIFIEEIMLNGIIVDEGIRLNWDTEMDEIDGFEIQRSQNNTDFFSIALIDTQQPGTYSYIDRSPFWGTNKYRVKIIFEDGTYDYTNRINFEYLGNQNFSVFPNPAKDLLNIKVVESNGSIKFDLYDSSGKLLIKHLWTDDLKDGITIPISLNAIGDGIYYYRIKNGLESFSGSILKLK